MQRQYDVAQAFFALPHEEKAKPEYKCDFANGNYFGYREIYEATIRGTAVRNNVEQWNHAKFTDLYAKEARHPFFAAYEREIAEFSRVRATPHLFPPMRMLLRTNSLRCRKPWV